MHGDPGGSSPPRPTLTRIRVRTDDRHVGICGLHTYTAHRRLWIPAGRNRQTNVRKEETVFAPIARIRNAIARYSNDVPRQPRWIDDANAEIARAKAYAAMMHIK